VLLSLAPACAHRAGRQATEGMLAELEEQQATRTGPPPSKIIAQNTIDGVMTGLDTPEQQARIQRLVSLAVAAATKTMAEDLSGQLAAATQAMADTMSNQLSGVTKRVVEDASDQLMEELGPDGSGPLAASLAQAGQRVSASVASGVVSGVTDRMGAELAALAPECTGPNRADCIEQRLQLMTRRTAASFTKGIHETIGWQLLVVAFALGAAGGVLASWLLSLIFSLRHERRTLRTV
jgi:hypothetical protein